MLDLGYRHVYLMPCSRFWLVHVQLALTDGRWVSDGWWEQWGGAECGKNVSNGLVPEAAATTDCSSLFRYNFFFFRLDLPTANATWYQIHNNGPCCNILQYWQVIGNQLIMSDHINSLLWLLFLNFNIRLYSIDNTVAFYVDSSMSSSSIKSTKPWHLLLYSA